MPGLKTDQLSRLVLQSDLSSGIGDFLIDRQARGLSPRTVQSG
jgi:hypothetical protein